MQLFHDYRFERGLFNTLNSIQPDESAYVFINPKTLHVKTVVYHKQAPYEFQQPPDYVHALTYEGYVQEGEPRITRDSLSEDLDDVIYQSGLPLC